MIKDITEARVKASNSIYNKKPRQTEYDKVIDALNFIDNCAENGNDTYDEQKERGRFYEIVANFIDKHAKR